MKVSVSGTLSFLMKFCTLRRFSAEFADVLAINFRYTVKSLNIKEKLSKPFIIFDSYCIDIVRSCLESRLLDENFNEHIFERD